MVKKKVLNYQPSFWYWVGSTHCCLLTLDKFSLLFTFLHAHQIQWWVLDHSCGWLNVYGTICSADFAVISQDGQGASTKLSTLSGKGSALRQRNCLWKKGRRFNSPEKPNTAHHWGLFTRSCAEHFVPTESLCWEWLAPTGCLWSQTCSLALPTILDYLQILVYAVFVSLNEWAYETAFNFFYISYYSVIKWLQQPQKDNLVRVPEQRGHSQLKSVMSSYTTRPSKGTLLCPASCEAQPSESRRRVDASAGSAARWEPISGHFGQSVRQRLHALASVLKGCVLPLG